MEPILRTKNLTKRYKKIEINISLEMRKGEFFILLGPNGAGKSTFIRMISTLTKPDAGSAKVVGFDLQEQGAKVRENIAVLFQETSLYEGNTAYHNLLFRARLYGIKNKEERIDKALKLVGLEDWKKEIVDDFSGGMKRKLELARVLLAEPELLILDEPTTGLDPGARKNILNYLEKINSRKDISILMTTHYSRQGKIADRIGIINKGKIVKKGSPKNLLHSLSETYLIETKEPEKAKSVLKGHYEEIRRTEKGVFIRMKEGLEELQEIIEKRDLGVTSIEILQKPNLDDVFLYYTGESLNET